MRKVTMILDSLGSNFDKELRWEGRGGVGLYHVFTNFTTFY